MDIRKLVDLIQKPFKRLLQRRAGLVNFSNWIELGIPRIITSKRKGKRNWGLVGIFFLIIVKGKRKGISRTNYQLTFKGRENKGKGIYSKVAVQYGNSSKDLTRGGRPFKV